MYPVSPAVDRHLAVAAATVKLRLAKVSHDVWRRLIDDIPELKADDIGAPVTPRAAGSARTTRNCQP